MTHQNHQTNGASLEDCHTNFFALTDLCGIKWRKLVLGERPNASNDPLDDPVLKSYSRCLAVDILCVWRRVAAPKPEPDPSSSFFDISLSVTGGSSASVTHPPLSLTAAKELWIFWYGEEPNLTDLLAPELKPSEGEQGSWESGITYECRSLLFKALHNLIERCLLSKDVVRLGRWFVQPCSNNDCTFGISSHHLSFSFEFFVHGDSTVCASMDLRIHPAIRPLTPEHLAEAAQSNGEGKPRAVILAPYGLTATLTGNSFRSHDPATQKILDDWCAFFPLCNRDNLNLPPIVEVISSGVKMRYPSKYVLVTDLDDDDYTERCSKMSSVPINESSINDLRNPLTMHLPPTPATIIPENVWQDCIVNPLQAATMTNTNQLTAIKEEIDDTNSCGIGNTQTSSKIMNLFPYTDPSQKVSCLCTKCKSKSNSCVGRSNVSNVAASTIQTIPMTTTTTTTYVKTYRSEKLSTRLNRIPFHKRPDHSEYGLSSIGLQTSNGSTVHATATTNRSTNDLNIVTTVTPTNQRTHNNLASNVNQTTSGLSFPRNPQSIPESLTAVPSVGSPGSAGPSPHPHSALSQPTSVPPADQLLAVISPIGPTSTPSMQPGTPIDHLDKNTPAPTPTDQQELKSTTASPYVHVAPSSVEPMPPATLLDQVKQKLEPSTNNNGPANSLSSRTSATGGNTVNNNNVNTKNNNNKTVAISTNGTASTRIGSNSGTTHPDLKNILSLLKRPMLPSRDYEYMADDDCQTHQLLYDYSTWDAWMNHPVKRYKPDDEINANKLNCNRNRRDLYSTVSGCSLQLKNPSLSNYPPMAGTSGADISDGHIKNEIDGYKTQRLGGPQTPNGEGLDAVSAADSNNESQPQIKAEPMSQDDVVDGNGQLIHLHGGKVIKQEPCDVDGDGTKLSNDNLFTSEGLQASYKDLEQIFDNSDDESTDETIGLHVHTPPGSNKSIGGLEDTKRCISSNNLNTGILRPEELSKMFPTPPSLEHHPNSSPCSGTIVDQHIDILMDSPNLGSPIDEPIEDWSYVYQPPTVFKFVGSSKYAPLTNLPSQHQSIGVLPSSIVYKPSWQQTQSQSNGTSGNGNNSQDKVRQEHQQRQEQQQQEQMRMQQQQQQQQHQQQQMMGQIANPMRIPTPNQMMVGMPRMGFTPQTQSMGLPPGMALSMHSPISPANVPFPGPNTPSPIHMMQPPYRRNLLPPPPPYEVAVASPATSTSSYLNKQFHSQEPTTPTVPRVPEANALLVNILLYDTALNLFRDHNFDSCTLCVCNAGHKCVGNIRGSDSGVYLALPGSNFNPSSHGINFNNGFNGLDGQNGYVDDDPIKCSCGFSAVINRRLAHRAGLFFEDEMEITGMAEDPVSYKKTSNLLRILNNDYTNNCRSINGKLIGSCNDSKVIIKAELNGLDGSGDDSSDTSITQMMMDLMLEQCAIIQSSSNSIHRAIRCFRNMSTTDSLSNALLNVLEFADAHDIISLALEHSRQMFEAPYQARMDLLMNRMKPGNIPISVHKWPYVKACGPRSNKDIIRVMKSMQPLLQDAFHKKCNTRLWDAPYTVQGPLTWRQFHRLASSSSGQCEPQPIPSVVVGHEKDWLSVSPYALQHWDKLSLEPYAYARDIAYIVITPDNDYIVNRAKIFFKELSTTYEMCKLGRHCSVKGWNGYLRVPKRIEMNSISNNNNFDEWFNGLTSSIGDCPIDRCTDGEMLKLYAYTCQQQLVPYLSKIPLDKSLLDPPEESKNCMLIKHERPMPSPMLPPSTPEPSQSTDKAPSTPKSSENDMDQRDSLNSSATTPLSGTEPFGASKDEFNSPCIVIYVIDPFSAGRDSQDLQRLACLSLLRCYSNILTSIPESIRGNITFQIISMESLLENGRSRRDRIRQSDEMRYLALSVFSQCRRHLTHSASVKSLTGFGTAANMELFLKNKDDKNRAPYKLYTPPYILSGRHGKSENTESFGTTSIEQQSSIMYLSYCLSEDQRWLLAVATDDRGELLETTSINIEIPNRRRRRKASARRMGLQKLMDFIIGIISQSSQPWRIVVGRIGRIGHGELKGWSWLLSKQNLLKASKQLKDVCEQCSLMYPHGVPSISSACLVTLEPDSKLRVMPDQFTPDERFSQISMQSPLSTPHDVTCTHILVFPTSAVAQSNQNAFIEQHMGNAFGIDDGVLFVLGDGEDDDNLHGIDDIFGDNWDNDIHQIQAASPDQISRHGSPMGLEDNRSRQSSGQGGGNCGTDRKGHHHIPQDQEEVGQVLQQPLALGYLVSTAPTGRMPAWFWSSCPHLENICPVFLKTALHLHSPSIQQNSDDFIHQNQSSATDHPLDSQYTADVLRYVLEGYNLLSWLAMDSNTNDRLSCLPVHVQVLMQLYHMTAALN